MVVPCGHEMHAVLYPLYIYIFIHIYIYISNYLYMTTVFCGTFQFPNGKRSPSLIEPTVTMLSGSLYVFGGEAVSLIPGAGFIPNSLNNLDGMLRDPCHGNCDFL